MTRLPLWGVVLSALLLIGCESLQKNPVQTASFVLQGINLVFSSSLPNRITVSATGVGPSRDSAIRSSLHIASQQAFGVLVFSETKVVDDRQVKDIAAQYSSAIVQSYEVEGCSQLKDHVTCQVSAVITPWRFYETLKTSSEVVKVDGEDLYANHLSKQHVLAQRVKVTDFVLSKIRTHGLEAKVTKVSVSAGSESQIPIEIEYSVRYKREFWNETKTFLERLERDTGGSPTLTGRKHSSETTNSGTVVIQWGPTGLRENRVFIHTNDASLWSVINRYRIQEPIFVSLPEFGICDAITLGDAYGQGFAGDIFQIDWYGLNRKVKILLPANRLKQIQQVSIKMGCN